MTILVTGSSGFVGRHLCSLLDQKKIIFYAGSQVQRDDPENHMKLVTGPLESPNLDLANAIESLSISKIVHLAGFAHEKNSIEKMRLSNVQATRNIVDAAVRAKVKKFVYLSSVKAHGEVSFENPISEKDIDRPSSLYGKSKLEAEAYVRHTCESNNINYLILRPTLVYGPRVKANFLYLLHLIDRFPVVPFGSLDNRRSICFVGNLTSAILNFVANSNQINAAFYIADRESVSMSNLLIKISKEMGKDRLYFRFPKSIAYLAAKIMGRMESYQKVVSNLEVSSSGLCSALEWQHPFSLDQGINSTVAWYKNSRQERV